MIDDSDVDGRQNIIDRLMTLSAGKKTTRQNLLDSAAVLFSEKGYGNTSVADICKLAGANIAAVNYHFQSKELLYREVLRYTFEQAESLYPLQIEDEVSVEEKLYQVVLSLLQRILSRDMKGNFYKLFIHQIGISGGLVPLVFQSKLT